MAKRRGNREGSIYQDTDGRWRAVVQVGFKDGRRIRKKFSGKTRGEVAEELKKALREQQLGLPMVPDRQTVGQFLQAWLEKSAKPRLRYKTYQSYEQLVRTHIGPTLGQTPLGKLSAQQIDGLLSSKLNAGLSARTVQYIHAVLRKALNEAVRWDLLPRNVASLVKSPKIQRKEIKPYSVEEARTLLCTVEGDRLEAVYTVAIACGLRQGEVLGLRWEDIDFERKLLYVRNQLQRLEDRKLHLVPLKTDESRRTVSLPGVCASALAAHRQQQEQERAMAGRRWTDTGLVFTSTIGTGIDQRNLLKNYSGVIHAAGLRRIRFHDLRHTAASLLLAQGVSFQAVQRTLGHADIRTTLNIYGHLYPESQKEVASKMDELFGKTQERTSLLRSFRRIQ